jgi:SAM-dependent methyltransferase
MDLDTVGLRDMVASGWFNAAAGELAPGFPISPDDLVVDIGAGGGGMAGYCARIGAQVILLDNDGERLADAVKYAASGVPGRVTGEVCDATRLSLPAELATRVICTEVLEHVDDPAAVMDELARIGAPGALYLLSVPGAVSERLQIGIARPSYFQKPNHVRIFEPDDLDRLAQNAGFAIERRGAHGFFWSLWWLFFWQLGIEPGEGSSPLLDAWTATWGKLLDTRDGLRIQTALNELAPKSYFVVARKPREAECAD